MKKQEVPATEENQEQAESVAEENQDGVPTAEGHEEEMQAPLSPPDGGYGWVVTFGCMCCIFSTWGAMASFGVFLDHYLTKNVFPGATKIQYAFIGGLSTCFVGAIAPIAAFLYKNFGFRPVMLAGLLLQVAGYLLASFATKLWQLFLTQGVLVGISIVLVYIPSTLVLPTWFTTKKATLIGLANAGSGLGGIVFCLSINKVIEETGSHRWALRMVCIVTAFTTLVAFVTVKPFNVKPQPLSKNIVKTIVQSYDSREIFKHYEFVLLVSWFILSFLGYILVLFLVASYALSIGLSHTQALNITSIVSAAQLVGRPIMGSVADLIGNYNAATVFSIFGTITVFAIWIQANNYGTLIAFSATFGLVSGVAITLGLPLVIDLLGRSRMNKIPLAWSGMFVLTTPFGLLAGAIGLGLTKSGAARPYLHSQIFTGCCWAWCSIAPIFVREVLVRRKFKERLQDILNDLDESENETHGESDHEKELVYDEVEKLHKEKDKLIGLLKPTVRGYFRRCFHLAKV